MRVNYNQTNKPMKTITQKYIKDYITKNYGQLRHDAKRLKQAINLVAKENDVNPKDLFHLLIENEPIPNSYTHSYGFHTGYGRHLIDSVIELY